MAEVISQGSVLDFSDIITHKKRRTLASVSMGFFFHYGNLQWRMM